MSVDREDVRQRVESLRRELPEGAPLVPIATVRARDRAEVRRGQVFDLGLASPQLADPSLGAFVHVPGATLRLFRGMLGTESFVAAARHASAQWLALAVDEVDEQALAAAILSEGRIAVLTPAGGPRAIDAVARATSASRGVLMPELRAGSDAGPLELLATTEQLVLLGAGDPVGLLFLGGDDLAHARERARVARELLRT